MSVPDTTTAERLPLTGAYLPISPFGPLSALALTLVIGVIALIAFVVFFVAAILARHGTLLQASILANPDGSPTLEGIALSLVGMIGAQAVMIGFAILFAGFKGVPRHRSLALLPARGGPLAYVIGTLGLFAGVAAIGFALDTIAPHDQLADLKLFIPVVHSQWLWLAVLVVVIGAPLSEEFLFRGFLFPALAKTRIGILGAGLVSTSVWTLLHLGYSWQGLVAVFSIGLIFTLILWRTGSLWVTILAHGIYNGAVLAFVRFGLAPPVESAAPAFALF